MKKLLQVAIGIIFLSCFSYTVRAEVKKPAKWEFKVTRKDAKNYVITYKVILEKKWHVYAQNPGEGPVATKVVLTKNPIVKTTSAVKEIGRLIKHFDQGFRKELKYYEDKLLLEQTITLKSPVKTQLKGYVEFMVCDDTRCLPPRKEKFVLDLQ